MDRNSIIGVLLIVGIILGYYLLSKPSQQQLDEIKRQQDSIAMVHQHEMIRQQKNAIASDSLKLINNNGLANDSISRKALVEKLGVFATAVKDTNEFITIENNLLKIKFCSKGGRPYSVELK